MTEKPGAVRSSLARLQFSSGRRLQLGARWLGQMGTELTTLTLPRLRSGFQRPWSEWVSARTLAAAFIAVSGLYCFGIGRDRYQATAEFVIKQPSPPSTAPGLLPGGLQSLSVLSSLEDGRYLQVYLGSNEVKQAVFPDEAAYFSSYAPQAPDVWSGLPHAANPQQQWSFFRNQLDVIPQELSGSIVLKTSAFTPQDAFDLNVKLLDQAQRFVNEVNQSISADQRVFAEQQVTFARQRLTAASSALEAFQDRYGQLSPLAEQSAAANFISELESRLVELKVEEASLRRQYRDPDAPEVAYVADQASELKRQIQEERKKAVGDDGRDLNRLASQSSKLEAEVTFARESLASAMRAAENSRIDSQRQLKFIVMLSRPLMPEGPNHSWRWQAFLSCVGILIVVWGVGGFMLTALRRD